MVVIVCQFLILILVETIESAYFVSLTLLAVEKVNADGCRVETEIQIGLWLVSAHIKTITKEYPAPTEVETYLVAAAGSERDALL